MFKNYLITAWRNLLKGKVFNAINIIGLTVAIACSTLLFLTVDYEMSFDRFHEHGDDMYQVYFTHNRAEETNKDTPMPEPITPALKSEFPDIMHITRMGNGGMLIRNGEKEIEKSLKYVDKDFAEVFTLKARSGNVKTMLSDPGNIVLSESLAKALFGTENPVGKSVELNYTGNGYERFTVSAVTEELPWNSSFQMDALIRFEHYRDYQHNIDKWDVGNHSVYLTLREGTDRAAFEKKLIPFAQKYFKKEIADMKRDGARPDRNGQVFTVNLLPFTDIHFNTEIGGLDGNTVSRIYLLTLLGTGIFILLIACINFINLNIARAFTRAREVGVRKTLGAGKNHLLVQFCLETALVCLIAVALGIVLASALLPTFRTLFRSHIEMLMLLHTTELLSAAGIFLLVTFAAGFYPAWLMLRYKTVQVLKGKVNATKPGRVRNVLLVTQFAISTLLIVCTLVTWQQMRYMQNMPLGYNRTEVISIPLGAEVMMSGENSGKAGFVPGRAALQVLRNRLQGEPGVVAITGARANLGIGNDGSTSTQTIGFTYKGHGVMCNLMQVDYDYLKTLDIKLTGGREFSRDFGADSTAVVINEQMAKQLGGKNIVGTYLPIQDNKPAQQVIGVMKDYNFRSLREGIQPMMLTIGPEKPIEYVFVRVRSANLQQSFEQVKAAWKKLYPNTEFLGSWLSENTDRQYRSEKNLSNMFVSGAVVAIMISCIGLLAIAMMVMVQRTKEIGVRKVLGASVGGLVALVSVDFLKLVLLAACISFPVAWYIMQHWLQDFVYRITISWWIFALSGISAAAIAFFTISFQAIKAALANPVKSLRSE